GATPAPPAATAAPAAAPAPAPTAAPAPAAAPSAASTPPPPAPASTPAAPAEPFVEINGYAQVEFHSHQESEDQLNQGNNAPLNLNRFLVRRARLSAKRAWEYTSLEIELDGNTVSGPSLGLYRAEASAYYRPDKSKLPLVQLTLGMFKIP